MSDILKVERRGAVLEITLDRPKANAIDVTTSRKLGEAFVSLRDDDELRVGIVTAAGQKFFSAGWDLISAARGDEDNPDYGPGGFAGLTELFDLNKPVIAAVNGMAVGGGAELVLACDLIIAADHVEFFFPETSLGNMADVGGVQRLPRQLPYHIAMELLLLGRRMKASEAAKYGLVNRVVPSDELVSTARSWADQLAESAPLSVQALKEAVRSTEHLSVEEAFKVVLSGQLPLYNRMMASEDFREGPRAFSEKRKPIFKGR